MLYVHEDIMRFEVYKMETAITITSEEEIQNVGLVSSGGNRLDQSNKSDSSKPKSFARQLKFHFDSLVSLIIRYLPLVTAAENAPERLIRMFAANEILCKAVRCAISTIYLGTVAQISQPPDVCAQSSNPLIFPRYRLAQKANWQAIEPRENF